MQIRLLRESGLPPDPQSLAAFNIGIKESYDLIVKEMGEFHTLDDDNQKVFQAKLFDAEQELYAKYPREEMITFTSHEKFKEDMFKYRALCFVFRVEDDKETDEIECYIMDQARSYQQESMSPFQQG